MSSKCWTDMDHGGYMSNKENVPPSINHITPTHRNLTIIKPYVKFVSNE